MPNVKNIGDSYLIESLRDMEKIEATVGELPVGPVRDLLLEIRGEIRNRKSHASTRVWELRMELQRAENKVRELEGRPLKPLGGVDGNVLD